MMQCDPITGTCMLPDLPAVAHTTAPALRQGLAVRYVGDPMCS